MLKKTHMEELEITDLAEILESRNISQYDLGCVTIMIAHGDNTQGDSILLHTIDGRSARITLQ